ncbi:MAG TPA: lysophospholipid acyltransferase family protein, partial [Pirellulales bacterium]
AAGDAFFDKTSTAVFAAGVLNALPLWRRKFCKQALHDLRERLHTEPCGYIIFPEGTRSRDGKMTAFKAGLGGLIAGSAVPVVPCHIAGAHAALPPGARWPRWEKLHLRMGPPLSFSQAANDREGWDSIATDLEAAVRRLGEA